MELSTVYGILFNNHKLSLSDEELDRVRLCHEFLKDFVKDKVIYGINTGFGPMAQWRVSEDHLKELQFNLIRSHATGVGEPLDDIEVKSAMIARIGTFLQARSGVSPETIFLLREFINHGIYPYVPRHGSVGASGDLVQLAHIALCLIGEGKVHYKGKWRKTSEVLSELNIKPMEILLREGLSAATEPR